MGQLFLVCLNFVELSERFILDVTAIELQECHYLAKIEVCIQVMVQRCSEVVNGEVGQVDSIPLAVVGKMGNSIDVVPLETIYVELAEIARVDR